MIFNMVSNRYRDVFAMVLVNYPQGSTITQATNVDGYKDIFPSSSANPQRLYYVSQPSGETQECQFTIEDTSTTPSRTKTQTVSEIAIGTAQTITLAYTFYIFQSGMGFIVPCTPTCESSSTISVTNNYIQSSYSSQWDCYSQFITQNKIDVRAYSKLLVDVEISSLNNEIANPFGLADTITTASQTPSIVTSRNYNNEAGSRRTLQLDISSFDTSYYIISRMAANAYTYNVWLE